LACGNIGTTAGDFEYFCATPLSPAIDEGSQDLNSNLFGLIRVIKFDQFISDLFIMLIATVIFLPLILAYTAWVYSVLWGKVGEKSIEKAGSSAY